MENQKKVGAEVRIGKSGPIRVIGNFYIKGVKGETLNPENPKEVYLCTCGRSGSKPFCDGSHNRVVIEKPLI